MNIGSSLRWLMAIWLGLWAGQCLGQGTLTITFDGPPAIPPSTAISYTSYSESGVSFTSPSGSFARIGSSPVSFRPDDGSSYVQAALGQSLSFHMANSSVFSLNAVDLAEYSTVVPDAATVHFIGYHPDGSTIETYLATDGIIDGTGPIQDFQTFNFTGWNNLTRVDIPDSLWSLDNVVVTPAPEPGTLALGVAGLSALLLARRRQR